MHLVTQAAAAVYEAHSTALTGPVAWVLGVEVGHPSVWEAGYWWVRGVAVAVLVMVVVGVLWEYEME